MQEKNMGHICPIGRSWVKRRNIVIEFYLVCTCEVHNWIRMTWMWSRISTIDVRSTDVNKLIQNDHH